MWARASLFAVLVLLIMASIVATGVFLISGPWWLALLAILVGCAAIGALTEAFL